MITHTQSTLSSLIVMACFTIIPSNATAGQVVLPRIDALINLPQPWQVLDFQKRSAELYEWLFFDNDAIGSSSFFNVSAKSYWYSGPVASFPSYLGQTASCSGAPGEALATIGVMYGAALSNFTQDKIPVESIAIYADPSGVFWNNPPGNVPATLPTFWYGLINQFMGYSVLDLHRSPIRHDMLRNSVQMWTAAVQVMKGSFNYTGFDFATMSPIRNGIWTEGDSAGGVAWLAVAAAHDAEVLKLGPGTGDRDRALALADTALQYLDEQQKSPLYECIMPLGTLAAARMNREYGRTYNVSKMLEFALSDGNNQFRQGWGMIPGGTKWGGIDVGGLIGSLTDGGGYAFTGNTLWSVAALSPIPRYLPEYSLMIAKWIYNSVNAAKLFFGDATELAGQSNPRDRWHSKNLVTYEGLRKCDFNRTFQRCMHGPDFGPFATGDWCESEDCDNITWDCKEEAPCFTGSDKVLYGGGALGVLGRVVSSTNDTNVLRIDVAATDVYSDKQSEAPTLLYFNPLTSRTLYVLVEDFQCTSKTRYKLYDLIEKKTIARDVTCSTRFAGDSYLDQDVVPAVVKIPPNGVVLVTLIPYTSLNEDAH